MANAFLLKDFQIEYPFFVVAFLFTKNGKTLATKTPHFVTFIAQNTFDRGSCKFYNYNEGTWWKEQEKTAHQMLPVCRDMYCTTV